MHGEVLFASSQKKTFLLTGSALTVTFKCVDEETFHAGDAPLVRQLELRPPARPVRPGHPLGGTARPAQPEGEGGEV